MATLLELAGTDVYSNGLQLSGADFIRAIDTEIWLGPLTYGQSLPAIATLTLDGVINPLAEGDLTMTVDTDVDVTIDRGDVILFDPGVSDVRIVVSAKTVVSGTDNVVPIFSAEAAISTSVTAKTYGLTRVESNGDGGDFSTSGTAAEARNKNQGMYPARAMVSKDGTMSLAGTYYVKDAGAALVWDEFTTTINRLFVQTRFSPFVVSADRTGANEVAGVGIGRIEGEFVLTSCSITDSARNEFISFAAELQISGRYNKYKLLV